MQGVFDERRDVLDAFFAACEFPKNQHQALHDHSRRQHGERKVRTTQAQCRETQDQTEQGRNDHRCGQAPPWPPSKLHIQEACGVGAHTNEQGMPKVLAPRQARHEVPTHRPNAVNGGYGEHANQIFAREQRWQKA